MASGELLLVTGGAGFIAVHCIIALIRQNYRVRTTLRSLKRENEVREMLIAGGVTEKQAKDVDFAVADLTKDDGWDAACKNCTYVLHVASPFPASAPKHPDELVVPAREGVLRALKAAKNAGSVRRVVLTSSGNAITSGHPPREKPFTEEDWSVLNDPNLPAYPRSKTVAEQAAWDWIAKEGGSMELAVVNPMAVFGPILGKDYSTSMELIMRLMNGELPGGVPQIGFQIVDVRDVADLHLRAMTDPNAKNERFIAASDDPFLSVQIIAQRLKYQLGDKARKVPTRVLPNFLVKLVGLFDGTVGMIVPDLGKVTEVTNKKAKDRLCWQPRSANETLKASAESLIEFGLVK